MITKQKSMPKRIDILNKHEEAIRELAKAGLVSPRLMSLKRTYETVNQAGIKPTAKQERVSVSIIYRRINFLETDI